MEGGATEARRPVKWYLSLFFIVVLGIVSVVYSRYERQHPVAAAQPAVGTKAYSALAFDVCGVTAADLPANPNQATADPGHQHAGRRRHLHRAHQGGRCRDQRHLGPLRLALPETRAHVFDAALAGQACADQRPDVPDRLRPTTARSGTW